MTWWKGKDHRAKPPAPSAPPSPSPSSSGSSPETAGPKAGFFKSLTANLTERQKQRAKIVIVVVCFILAIITLVQLSEAWQKRSKEKRETVDYSKTNGKKMTLLSERVERDLWVAAEGQNIKAIEKSNEELRAEVTRLREDLDKTKKEQKAAVAAPTKTVTVKVPMPAPPVPGAQAVTGIQRVAAEKAAQVTGAPPPTGVPPLPGALAAGGPPVPALLGGAGRAGGPSIRVIEDDYKGKNRDQNESQGRKKQKNDEWLPSGSFMKAVLLNGIDAPTSGGAQSEPYPVLMSVLDIATLPNRFRLDMKECFIIGAGYGNISDERAYVRTEKLSCVRKDGQAVDFDLAGHVIGEDGKLGMRGRLVSKQGQQIAMSLFAGTLAGLGTALKPTGTISLNLNNTDTTNVQRPEFGDVMASAGLGGAGTALDRVAQHYLKMAEKIFPIIEIDAGRRIEVVVLKGRSMKETPKDMNTEGNKELSRSEYDQVPAKRN
jgi:conjugal transfer pilus assembly protein TraB